MVSTKGRKHHIIGMTTLSNAKMESLKDKIERQADELEAKRKQEAKAKETASKPKKAKQDEPK